MNDTQNDVIGVLCIISSFPQALVVDARVQFRLVKLAEYTQPHASLTTFATVKTMNDYDVELEHLD